MEALGVDPLARREDRAAARPCAAGVCEKTSIETPCMFMAWGPWLSPNHVNTHGLVTYGHKPYPCHVIMLPTGNRPSGPGCGRTATGKTPKKTVRLAESGSASVLSRSSPARIRRGRPIYGRGYPILCFDAVAAFSQADEQELVFLHPRHPEVLRILF